MTRTRRAQKQLERIESMPAVVSPSLEQAFMEIEKPMVRVADSETPARANRATLAQDGR
jgi:hypothetical protein